MNGNFDDYKAQLYDDYKAQLYQSVMEFHERIRDYGERAREK